MKSGERLSFTYTPDGGVLVDVGGAVEASSKGMDRERVCTCPGVLPNVPVRKEMRMTRTQGAAQGGRARGPRAVEDASSGGRAAASIAGRSRSHGSGTLFVPSSSSGARRPTDQAVPVASHLLVA